MSTDGMVLGKKWAESGAGRQCFQSLKLLPTARVFIYIIPTRLLLMFTLVLFIPRKTYAVKLGKNKRGNVACELSTPNIKEFYKFKKMKCRPI